MTVIVIGLEVHVQLATRTKLFCACPTTYGAPANSQVCPTCLGYPGALPVLKREAMRLAVRAALALSCEIHQRSKFDRKNYFYPDLPKGYQISQFDEPYATGGAVPIELADGERREIPLTRIHLEEDAGKSIHDARPGVTSIDLNRCGTPLIEIVSTPALRSAAEASAYVRAIRELVRWIGVSDGNMEEGSMRCDVNLSLRDDEDTPLGTRTEIKNLNSFVSIEQAIAAESERQREVLRSGEAIVQETRLWDAERGVTVSMRRKEEAHDYRYFPEPDLTPVRISAAEIDAERAAIPELPECRRERYVGELRLAAREAAALLTSRAVADYFEAVCAAGIATKSASNWVQGDVRRELNERGIEIGALPVAPSQLAAIIEAVDSERVSVAIGRQVLATAIDTGRDVAAIIAEQGPQVSGGDELQAWVDEAITANPDAVAKVLAGDSKTLQFLVGQVMKASRGQANPRRVTEWLREQIGDDSP